MQTDPLPHSEAIEDHVLAPTFFDTIDRSIRCGEGPPLRGTGDSSTGFTGVDGGLRPQLSQQLKEGTLDLVGHETHLGQSAGGNLQYTIRWRQIGFQLKTMCGGIQ